MVYILIIDYIVTQSFLIDAFNLQSLTHYINYYKLWWLIVFLLPAYLRFYHVYLLPLSPLSWWWAVIIKYTVWFIHTRAQTCLLSHLISVDIRSVHTFSNCQRIFSVAFILLPPRSLSVSISHTYEIMILLFSVYVFPSGHFTHI